MKSKIGAILFWVVLCVLLFVSAIFGGVFEWFDARFGVSFEEVLFTLTSPLEGSDVSFVDEAVEYVVNDLLSHVGILALIVAFYIFFKTISIRFRIQIRKMHKELDFWYIYCVICILLVVVLCCNTVNYGVKTFGIDEYVERKIDKTTIYEEYYIDPKDVAITSEGEARNLIYIYLESMETTYVSSDLGGYQKVNYIPRLTEMAQNYVSFSDKETMGGANLTPGSTWTMGALLSSTSGVPFSVPIGGNDMDRFEKFMPGITTLGDVLEAKGYNQMFLCGSDGKFGGREKYFTQHGNYDVVDYYDAIDKGYIEKDYYVWWGYEDLKLYEIAKDELLELAGRGKPFNFTMLTVDTHHMDGYVCENCEETYPNQLANVLQCSDKQIYEFINWCKEQEFYENTTIIVTGDHFRMDSSLIPEGAERRVYNCYINSAVEPEGAVTNRNYTTFDFFPTTLAAMGYKIEGERLGLGTNLFSKEKTLTEQLGYEFVSEEVGKYSQFYKDNLE